MVIIIFDIYAKKFKIEIYNSCTAKLYDIRDCYIRCMWSTIQIRTNHMTNCFDGKTNELICNYVNVIQLVETNLLLSFCLIYWTAWTVSEAPYCVRLERYEYLIDLWFLIVNVSTNESCKCFFIWKCILIGMKRLQN